MFSRLSLAALVMLAFVGCFRGQRSEKPPIHLFTDMQDQPKYNPYGKSAFFKNEATMQQPIEGAVSNEDTQSTIRPALDANLLETGQKKYQIYCEPCHGAVGDGKGMVAIRGIPKGLIPPTSYHSDQMRGQSDQHFYEVVTNGVRNMSGYGSKLSVQERWSIVEYVRVLQRSQYATLSDVPEEQRAQLQKGIK